MSKHVYHIGDHIRILRPRIIRRVGYPLHFRELRGEASSILHEIGGGPLDLQHGIGNDLIDALAKALVADRRFGGNIRSIHYYTIDPALKHKDENQLWSFSDLSQAEEDDWFIPRADPTGLECRVLEKYIRMTGERFPPWWGHEGDYEPGGLSNAQSHIILRTHYGDFETCDVEPVE